MPFFLTLIRALHEAGIIITAGTDCSTLEGSVQSNIHRELELLVESGLSPYEALRAGTINASAIAGRMGKDAAFGAIAIGNRADLLLLEEDPLEDVGHTRSRLGVVVRGRWFSQEELDERVAALVASY